MKFAKSNVILITLVILTLATVLFADDYLYIRKNLVVSDGKTATIPSATITSLTAPTLSSTAATITTGNITTANITTLNGIDHVRILPVNVFDEDVAASQNAAAWGLQAGADVGGGIKGIVIGKAGSIVGISVYSDATCTSGTLTADATINGTATGLQCGLNSTVKTTKDYLYQALNADTIAAGDIVGVKVTTSSTWAPTTADVVVTVFVEY